jgi:hypothetical protein
MARSPRKRRLPRLLRRRKTLSQTAGPWCCTRLRAKELWLRSVENLPVAKAKPGLLNQRHALHENYTDYGYHCFSRSR